MKIYITSGEGHGSTLISAFDFALKDAGVYNYNLIPLSSIIPPHSEIKTERFKAKKDEYGHRLYVVKAEMRSREVGKHVGAAVGWYQLEDGRGVFVEHETIGNTKEIVEANLVEDVTNSIVDLCYARDYQVKKNKISMKLSVTSVVDSAACALVLAVYKAVGWETPD